MSNNFLDWCNMLWRIELMFDSLKYSTENTAKVVLHSIHSVALCSKESHYSGGTDFDCSKISRALTLEMKKAMEQNQTQWYIARKWPTMIRIGDVY